jgi:chromosome segregation ATPase
MKDADPTKIAAAAKDPSKKQPDAPTKPGSTGQKKEVAGMITQMASTEQKIKET